MLEFKEKEDKRALHIEVEKKLLEEVKKQAKIDRLSLRDLVEAGFILYLREKGARMNGISE
jgi:hypothetical protein